jgi:thiopeptide-type bacteriocin biosynthesis protein
VSGSRVAEVVDFFVLRTPLLPFQTFVSLADSPWPRLCELFVSDPVVREAILVASPGLYDALQTIPEAAPRLQGALQRYVARMAARATPFGLMAGVARGAIAPRTHLELGEARRHLRLDHGFLARTVERLAASADVRPALVCTPNETLSAHGHELRYVESRIEGETHTYRLSTLEPDEALTATLLRAHTGARLESLARGLVDDDPEIDPADALDYVTELLAQDVLRHDLTPPGTGGDALAQTLASLEKKGIEASDLAAARERLRGIGAAPPGVPADEYRALAALLPSGIEAFRQGALVQAELILDGSRLTIGRALVERMFRAAEVLRRLFGDARDEELVRFREHFRERFDRREVPLLRALDPDHGVRFGNDAPANAPLIDGLALPAAAQSGPSGREVLDRLLLCKIQEAVSRGVTEVELTPEEVAAAALAAPLPLPATFALYGAVLQTDGRTTVRLDGLTGASGARLLGRFAAVMPQLEDDLRRYLQNESDTEAVCAEIVHVPEGRLGNVMARPVLHPYEIPIAGRSGAPPERQIPLDDLHLSLIGDELVLRSARLGVRILPRLTSAHNYHAPANVPLYRFLCKLQGQSVASNLTWRWGRFETAPFLPAINYEGVPLSRAQWTLPAAGFSNAGAVSETRRRFTLPRFLEHERLAIDLDNALSVSELIRVARQRPALQLRELSLAQVCARTPRGLHAHEIIVPAVSRIRSPQVQPRPVALPAVARTFPPGSLWTYLKLYCARPAADRLLTDVVAPAIVSLLRDGAADRWFYARYADPEPHLRVRVRGDFARIAASLNEALAPASECGIVWRAQYDTYEREIERYGGPRAIEHAEEIFHCDAEAAVALLALPQAADDAWRTVLASIHALVRSMTAGDDDAPERIVRMMAGSFARELAIGSAERQEIGRRFRALRPRLEPADAAVRAILDDRSSAMRQACASLHDLRRRDALTAPWDRMVASILHMSVNRLVSTEQRAQEMILYEFLDRLLMRRQYGVDA